MDEALTIPTAVTKEKNNSLTDSIKAYSRRLLGFIKQRVKNNEDAEDILQDVFYQFAGNPEPIEQVTSWLFTVARNKITDRYRKQQLPLADDLQTSSGNQEESFDWKDMVPSNDDSAETIYLRNLFWDELQLALNELPAVQRDAFIQNEIEGISFRDISLATSVAVPTLISRKRYAVLFLRDRLQGFKDDLLQY